jgi:hypothetical protein
MILYINTDNSWSNIKASYLISSRKDFILGSFAPDISDLVNTGASSKIVEHALVDCNASTKTSKNMKLIYLISGLKTSDNLFNIDLSDNKFINGKISVKVLTDANPAIELIYITYIIFENAAPFTFQTYNPSKGVINAGYIFEGVNQINGNSIITSGYGFNSNLPTILNFNCVGPLCKTQCITKSDCTAVKGVILQKYCYLCGNGKLYSNGQCFNNCALN